MTVKTIHLGATTRSVASEPVSGGLTTEHGQADYRILNYDQMRPFLMTIVSDSDHWMFISSTGALTAGRKNPDHALFPYCTDDKIHDSAGITGSSTLLLVDRHRQCFLWEPFSQTSRDVYRLQRNLYKSLLGNRILFEEVNHDLALTFHYAWTSSAAYGFVKCAGVRNNGAAPVGLRILDGLQNLLPYGVNRAMQASSSTLIDAYKKNEIDPETGLGIFTLSSIPVDRPEPSEALKAASVWSAGLPNPQHLLSTLQLDAFRDGRALSEEIDVRAERGAYFVHASLSLEPQTETNWSLVAEVDQGPAELAALLAELRDPTALATRLRRDVEQGTERLQSIVARADGLQTTADRLSTARHYSNVLFNVMRGGVFDDNYQTQAADVQAFVVHHYRQTAHQAQGFFESLPNRLPIAELLAAAAQQQNPQLRRLCGEYLPLMFSRRHGDPSRPWNDFSIDVRNEDGSRNLSYQGNWRDIFQNWEALSRSYPGFIEGMICKFLNASTADGYNPYRITRDGIDWEIIEPNNPWSHIGYWGDHQVIYLLKLLEVCRDHYPATLSAWLTQDLFANANIPYRIKPYADLLADPHHTIDFAQDEQSHIAQRVAEVGSDGKLLWNGDNKVRLVNLTEKLLICVLAKLSNFVPEAGIWMNTQRPEWNDANNALVGYGASVVTLCYVRRFLLFLTELLRSLPAEQVDVSKEVAQWLAAVSQTFQQHRSLLDTGFSDRDRKAVLDELGVAGSIYRWKIYEHGFSEQKKAVVRAELLAFCDDSLAFVDQSIRANRRPDQLFHAYNLLSMQGDGEMAIEHLYEMLEGQVAVLSCGMLSAQESLDVLTALKSSAMYRGDQRSYLLYPDRTLPRFLDKNRIPVERIADSPLLNRLVEQGNSQLILRDVQGGYHFNGALRNAAAVGQVLDRLGQQSTYRDEVARDRKSVLGLWEELFQHRSYTGRSGTFFGYEGLGCIYWHMVSKLLLAVQESFFRAVDAAESPALLDRLAECYYEIREGIGVSKNPAEYGAFPIDPYSHTPGNTGAQQPGMTGQVKEDILCRWGELGVCVSKGRIRFRPHLLRQVEFFSEPGDFHYIDLAGNRRQLPLAASSLAFTFCQVPVVYRLSQKPRTIVKSHDGRARDIDGLEIDIDTSTAIFLRQHGISLIQVDLMPGR